MVLLNHSFVSFVALLGAIPLASGRSLRHTFIPRQASPSFSGCSYPPGWESCNDKDNRGCWVKDPNGKEFNVNSDYEDEVPQGIERTYNLEITEQSISPDGVPKPRAQLINGKYPGEQIEACWGDTLIINVKNSLERNGTTIHWHGLRMFGTNEMDGVNGVTQCPIAQDETFQYKFRLTQYGHTWYHSHYSSQYSDGVAAPFLIHGPHTADWDEEWSPIIVADWFHKSAFEVFHQSLITLPAPGNSILVNGTGHYKDASGKMTGSYFQQSFEPGKRYLIRIINGGTDFHFHFSIDGHEMQVVGADMVPIEPFNTTSLSVGIGQRYSVIVQAKEQPDSSNGKYWIRTEYTTTGGCNFALDYPKPDDLDGQRTGIVSYPNAGAGDPTTERHDATISCADTSFTPKVKWTVSAPQNNPADNTHFAGNDRTNQPHGTFHWELAETPLWLNFSDPTVLNLDNTTWNPEYAIEPYNYGNGEEFVYMVINSGNGTNNMLAGHHPIHLHGHDFAIISQGPGRFDPAQHPYNLDNPPRRDVAMLPDQGHLVLAFKPDNPGVWIIHCHIGWHAGSGLALQVIERQPEIEGSIGSLAPVRDGCQKWGGWMATHPDVFNYAMQEDSGI